MLIWNIKIATIMVSMMIMVISLITVHGDTSKPMVSHSNLIQERITMLESKNLLIHSALEVDPTTKTNLFLLFMFNLLINIYTFDYKLFLRTITFLIRAISIDVVTCTEAGALILLGKDRRILILAPDISRNKGPASVHVYWRQHCLNLAGRNSLCSLFEYRFMNQDSSSHRNITLFLP